MIPIGVSLVVSLVVSLGLDVYLDVKLYFSVTQTVSRRCFGHEVEAVVCQASLVLPVTLKVPSQSTTKRYSEILRDFDNLDLSFMCP